MSTLSGAQINEAIASDLPGWEFDGTHLKKEFVFKGHKSAIAYIVRLAFDSEAADHHPDLENHYNKVIVAFRSWDAGGITDKDVEMAKKAERAAASFG